MISASDRRNVIELIEEAVRSGARKTKACRVLHISSRTFHRWQRNREDGRPHAQRPNPANKLRPEEQEKILEVVNSPKYKSQPPSQIVPDLADNGVYLGSESTIYRVMKAHDLHHHRGTLAAGLPPRRRD